VLQHGVAGPAPSSFFHPLFPVPAADGGRHGKKWMWGEALSTRHECRAEYRLRRTRVVNDPHSVNR
jgi:hypothetical protein